MTKVRQFSYSAISDTYSHNELFQCIRTHVLTTIRNGNYNRTPKDN